MDRFNRKYKKIRLVGQGAHGRVFLVEDREENRLAVVKVVDSSVLNDMEVQAVLNEIAIMEVLQHPFTVRYFDHLILGKSICIVMQYAEGNRGLIDRRQPRRAYQRTEGTPFRARYLL